jgi:type VI protein secretion system component Hcp
MGFGVGRREPRENHARASVRLFVATLACSLFGFGGASAHVGDAFMSIPGVAGTWKVRPYSNWLKIEAHYWKSDEGGTFDFGRRASFRRQRMFFLGPGAPRSGPDRLIISVDKRSPALPRLMAQCAAGKVIPEMTFAESADHRRGLNEIGERPANIPAFFEYRLKDVRLSDCTVVAGAAEQAFVVSFGDIQWLNYASKEEGQPFTLAPAKLTVSPTSGTTRTFVLSWFGSANDVSDDQCPQMNKKPTEEDFYRLMSREQAQKVRAEMASKGGVAYENGDMSRRGPNRINACLLPGILPDPGHATPQTSSARGFDLDGDTGGDRPPAGVCKHKNYVSQDGLKGIDNQMYTVQGCMPGYQGRKGFLEQYRNEQMRNGALSILVQIKGIDDDRNDNSVEVLILFSKDPMAKSADGSQILHDYTYRLTDDTEYSHYTTRLTGRIVNGVVVTDPVKTFQLVVANMPELTLHQARMRLQIMPDGRLKGLLGGYQEWRKFMATNANSNSENLYGFQCPGLYNALKRNADGLKDPVTGECAGISAAYDFEGSRAFVSPKQYQALIAQAQTRGR